MKRTRKQENQSILPLFIAVGLMFFMFSFSGCVLIPVGCETDSREVIGARADSEGKVCEQIVHYEKRLNFVAIGITPEGLVASSYWRYSRYAAVTPTSKRAIWSMEHFPSLAWTQVNTAIPIPDSDRWITFEHNDSWTPFTRIDCKPDENDIYLIVFSVRKGKIVRHRFRHVKRDSPRDAKTLVGWLYIEGNSDLSCLRVHETDMITLVNTVTGEIVPETDEMSPFGPTYEVNWDVLNKLCEQPMLRSHYRRNNYNRSVYGK